MFQFGNPLICSTNIDTQVQLYKYISKNSSDGDWVQTKVCVQELCWKRSAPSRLLGHCLFIRERPLPSMASWSWTGTARRTWWRWSPLSSLSRWKYHDIILRERETAQGYMVTRVGRITPLSRMKSWETPRKVVLSCSTGETSVWN